MDGTKGEREAVLKQLTKSTNPVAEIANQAILIAKFNNEFVLGHFNLVS